MDSEKLNDLIVTFTLTASPITSVIPLGILYHVYSTLTPSELKNVPSLHILTWLTPTLLGAFHAILYVLLENVIPRKVNNTIYLRYIVTGALAVLAVASVYHAWFDIFVGVMKYENPMMCLASVFVAGLVFFYTIGSWVRYQILYGPPTPTLQSPTPTSILQGKLPPRLVPKSDPNE